MISKGKNIPMKLNQCHFGQEPTFWQSDCFGRRQAAQWSRPGILWTFRQGLRSAPGSRSLGRFCLCEAKRPTFLAKRPTFVAKHTSFLSWSRLRVPSSLRSPLGRCSCVQLILRLYLRICDRSRVILRICDISFAYGIISITKEVSGYDD